MDDFEISIFSSHLFPEGHTHLRCLPSRSTLMAHRHFKAKIIFFTQCLISLYFLYFKYFNQTDFILFIFIEVGNVCGLSCIWLFGTPWTLACQAPLSMGFPRPEHWSRLPFLPPGNLPDPGIEPMSPVLPALAGRFFTTLPAGKPPTDFILISGMG